MDDLLKNILCIMIYLIGDTVFHGNEVEMTINIDII